VDSFIFLKNSLLSNSREIFFDREGFSFEITGSFFKSIEFTCYDDCYWLIWEYIEFNDGECKLLYSCSNIKSDEFITFKSKDCCFVAIL